MILPVINTKDNRKTTDNTPEPQEPTYVYLISKAKGATIYDSHSLRYTSHLLLIGMATQFERYLLISLSFICAWFCLTTIHFFSQISSYEDEISIIPVVSGIRKPGEVITEAAQNKVSQIRLTDFEAKEIMKKIPFPQSIKNEEWETIIHPSVAMMPRQNANKTDTDRHEMKVPKFWSPEIFGPDVRTYLGNYGERLITPEEASRIGSLTSAKTDYDIKDGDTDLDIELEYDKKGDVVNVHYILPYLPPGQVQMLETIFVTIASYRDYRCPHTLEALFEQATYPERIRVGIVDQFDPKEDENCAKPKRNCDEHPNDTLCKYSHQIDVYEMDATLAVGPVFARHIGDRMYRGEYFAMQSDAHMEFVKEWDVDVISQWKSANNEMGVLSTYVSNVNNHYDKKTGTRSTNTRPYMCYTIFETDYYNEALSFLMHDQQPEAKPEIDEPTLSPFWAAGFSFSRGHFAVQVPYDQYQPMIFQGEEISIGIRGFTFGYDYYAPEKSILFHYYNHDTPPDDKKKKKEVAKFWEHSDAYEGVEQESKARLLGIIEMLGVAVAPDEEIHEKVPAENDKGVEGEENEGAADEEEIVEIEWNSIDAEKYNVGKVRTVKKFLDTFGIDLASKTTQDNMCDFVSKDMTTIFKKQMRKDRMGVDYSKTDFRFQDPEKYGRTWEKYL